MMTWDDIQRTTNRALAWTLDWKKLIFTFLLLLIGGWVMVVCRGLAIHAGKWAALSLLFLPIFITAALLMAGGVVLVRVYHDQVKQRPVEYRHVIFGSWQLMVTAFSMVMAILLLFFGIWLVLGLFHVLTAIPVLGDFFGVVLAFGPFVLHVALILLMFVTIGMLFFVTPVLALRGVSKGKLGNSVWQRVQSDFFSNAVELISAVGPFILSLIVLLIASRLTWHTGFTSVNPYQAVLQWFFLMIPFMALLAPSIVFFFNIAAEAHVLFQSRQREP